MSKLFTEYRRILDKAFIADEKYFRNYVVYISLNPNTDFRAAAQNMGGESCLFEPKYFTLGQGALNIQ